MFIISISCQNYIVHRKIEKLFSMTYECLDKNPDVLYIPI